MKAPTGLYIALLACAACLQAQPFPAPTVGDAPCSPAPSGDPGDFPSSFPEADGFVPLFNGKDFTGWWQNCGTSSNPDSGGIFRVDTALKALYTTQRGGNGGGILMTRRKFTHYELIFDYWPDFGNDAQLYNRSTSTGAAYATTLSYIGGTCIGGVWGANGFTGRDYRPFLFGRREDTIQLESCCINPHRWDLITSRNNPTSYGCDSSGCKAKDWTRLWDIDGWNQIRQVFYGGTEEDKRLRMKAWFKRPESAAWVPLIADSTLMQVVPPGYIGLLVHGGGRYGGPRGTWYRNIRYRPTTELGIPLLPLAMQGGGGRIDSGRDLLVRERTKDIVKIRSKAGHPLASMSIHDMRGGKVRGLRIAGTEAEWHAQGLPKGLYFLRMEGVTRAILR